MSKVKTALENIFKEHRVVFWYNANEDLNFEYGELEIENIEKVVVENNEFSVKYRIIKQEPNKKFLLYFNKEKPIESENWLLDLNIAGYEFYTDPSSIYLQELNLPQEFKPLIQSHIEFCKSSKRMEKLKELISPEESERKLKYKMISVIALSNAELKSIILSLFTEMVKENDDKYSLIKKCSLDKFLWEEVRRFFGYSSEQPTLLDFAIEIFKANFNFYTNKRYKLSQDAIVFLSSWIDSSRYNEYYITLSNKLENDLSIGQELQNVEYKTLLKANVFRVVEQKILSGLKADILAETINYNEAKEIIKLREDRFWYSHYESIYKALNYAIEFQYLLKKFKSDFNTLEEGYDKYINEYYKIDLNYRKYLYEYQSASNNSLLNDLTETIEKQYSNNYLLALNDRWQNLLDKESEWRITGNIEQRNFFNIFIKPYIEKGNRIFVIISDALRYEIGQELLTRLLQEKRFEATIANIYTSLPSYTKLGMAALLPHKQLSFKEKSEEVLCDGNSTIGLDMRNKALQKYVSDGATIKSEDFLRMPTKTGTQGREFVKAHSVIYIYSNIIDKIGDDADSETKVIKAVEDEIENIIGILKHIVNCNGNNAIITADHGFIYQNKKLEESDFAEYERSGDIYKENRRFIVGKNLNEASSVKKFNSSDLGIHSENEVLITKSINRLRIKRAGSRYVHGGASLQEIVVPVIEFNKKRIGEIEKVDVDLIKSFEKITANQVAIKFYQSEKIEEKILPRELRIGFYSEDKKLISDQPTLIFNSTENDSEVRTKSHRFSFVQGINKYNSQYVYLILEEKMPNTNQFIEYKKFKYNMQISFTSDFDEF